MAQFSAGGISKWSDFLNISPVTDLESSVSFHCNIGSLKS